MTLAGHESLSIALGELNPGKEEKQGRHLR